MTLTTQVTFPDGTTRTVKMPGTDWFTITSVLTSSADVVARGMADILDILPNFDPGITLVAHAPAAAWLVSEGFTDVIDIDSFSVGDKWILANGSYLELTVNEGVTGSAALLYKYKDGSTVYVNGSTVGNNVNTNQINPLLSHFPEEQAREINENIRSVLTEGGYSGSSLLNYDYNCVGEIMFYYQPQAYPPSVILSAYKLSNRDRFVFPPQPVLASSTGTGVTGYNQFYDGIDLTTDPYEDNPDGPSSTGGGDGETDTGGDPIDIPGLPPISAADTGFISLFNPSLAQLQSLASYLWSGAFDVTTFKKLFADPMDTILGLSILPVLIPNGGTAEVKVGNVGTGVQMTRAGSQYVERDCGTLKVAGVTGSYLDYEPYTKCEIYLPFIGIHAINTDDIMRKNVRLVYHIDILTGACVAYIKCGSSVLYQYTGSCACNVPLSGTDWTQTIQGAISIAAAIGTMTATGGASAPLSLGNIASAAVNSMKPTIEKSGSNGGAGALMGGLTPYLIITRPRQCIPNNQNKYLGYPAFVTKQVGDISGYAKFETIRLSGLSATDDERAEIENLLKGGVIV